MPLLDGLDTGGRASKVEHFPSILYFFNIKLRQEISSSTINIAMTNDPIFSPLIVHISAHVRPENKIKIKKKLPPPIILTHVTGTKHFFGLRRNSWRQAVVRHLELCQIPY